MLIRSVSNAIRNSGGISFLAHPARYRIPFNVLIFSRTLFIKLTKLILVIKLIFKQYINFYEEDNSIYFYFKKIFKFHENI